MAHGRRAPRAGPPSDRRTDISRALQKPAFIAITRIGGAGLGFVTQAVLARLLGASGLGLFDSWRRRSPSWPATSRRSASRRRRPVRGPATAPRSGTLAFGRYVTRATLDSFAAGLVAAVLVAAAAALLPGLGAEERLTYGMAGILLLAATSLTLYTNLAGAIRAFGLCYLPEGIGRPLVFLVLIVTAALIGHSLSALVVMAIYTAVTAFIAIAQFVATRRLLPAWSWPRAGDHRVHRHWRREAWPLILLSLYTNTFADIGILFATPFLAKSEIAVFGLCLKLSLLVGYVVQVAQQMVVPDLADSRIARDGDGIRTAIRRATLLPVAITVAATVVCALVGDRILGVFGPEFVHDYAVLVIVVASQAVRAAAGPGSQLLNLAGAQKTTAALCLASLGAYVAATLALSPWFGPIGVALAVLISFAVWGRRHGGRAGAARRAADGSPRGARPGRAGGRALGPPRLYVTASACGQAVA